MSKPRKTHNFEVKKYTFGQLVPTDVTQFQNDGIYEFRSLDAAKDFKNNISADAIRSERLHARRTGFEVLPTIQEHRGLKAQEEADYEARIQAEVAKRFAAVKEQAFQEGLAQGIEEGRESAYKEAMLEYEAQINHLAQNIENLQGSFQAIYEKSREEAYQMVKNLTKWVILKEVDEKYYLVRLLEKLIHEINTKSNLVVRVSEKSFGYMPEVVKIVERKLGVLTNVRLEVDVDQTENGIILESENTIIDGSLEAQFKSIDRLFETVGINE